MFVDKRGTAWKGSIGARGFMSEFFAICMPFDAVFRLPKVISWMDLSTLKEDAPQSPLRAFQTYYSLADSWREYKHPESSDEIDRQLPSSDAHLYSSLRVRHAPLMRLERTEMNWAGYTRRKTHWHPNRCSAACSTLPRGLAPAYMASMGYA